DEIPGGDCRRRCGPQAEPAGGPDSCGERTGRWAVRRTGCPRLSASLQRACAGEVAERLPRLLAATERLTDTAGAAGQVVSDAHALASSAAVVGVDAAAHAARACEQLLSPYAAN